MGTSWWALRPRELGARRAAGTSRCWLVALAFGFGLGAIVVWSARRLGGQLARSLLLLARAIPLLLFFAARAEYLELRG